MPFLIEQYSQLHIKEELSCGEKLKKNMRTYIKSQKTTCYLFFLAGLKTSNLYMEEKKKQLKCWLINITRCNYNS